MHVLNLYIKIALKFVPHSHFFCIFLANYNFRSQFAKINVLSAIIANLI